MHTLPFQKHLLYLGAILIRYSFFKDLAELRLRFFVCAGHVRQLGGESPLPILTEEKG
jgi:hypothetical protein